MRSWVRISLAAGLSFCATAVVSRTLLLGQHFLWAGFASSCMAFLIENQMCWTSMRVPIKDALDRVEKKAQHLQDSKPQPLCREAGALLLSCNRFKPLFLGLHGTFEENPGGGFPDVRGTGSPLRKSGRALLRESISGFFEGARGLVL